MKILNFNDRLWWLAAREGKITGTRAKEVTPKLRGNGKKIGFYALIAEKLGIPSEEVESPLERGSRLEKEALERFEIETGKKVDGSLIMWVREDNENIAISPDGVVIPKKKEPNPTEACEVKCLAASRHIEAYVKKNIQKLPDLESIPEEYEEQALQYFVVNDDLKKLNFICYDPRFAMNPNLKIDFFYFVITREMVDEKVKAILEQQKNTLKEVNEIVNQLTF